MESIRMETLHNSEFGAVRIIQEGERYLFCGSDVARALGYANPQKAIRDHCRYRTNRSVPHPQSAGKQLEVLFIPEGDVYRLIAHSKLPAVERFEQWVFDEVLPLIRRHGAYMTPSFTRQALESPEVIYRLAEQMLAERAKNAELAQSLAKAQSKADFYDAFIHPEDCTNLRITAKELNVPERVFTAFLVSRRYLYRCPAGNLMPYAKPSNKALFLVKDYITASGYHGAYTLITPRGKLHFLSLLGEMTEPNV